MGNIETKTKFSRLKSISNIENNYLEAATGSVLQKKAFLKNFAVCWFKFIEETPTQVLSCAYCKFLSVLKNICKRLLLIIFLLQ